MLACTLRRALLGSVVNRGWTGYRLAGVRCLSVPDSGSKRTHMDDGEDDKNERDNNNDNKGDDEGDDDDDYYYYPVTPLGANPMRILQPDPASTSQSSISRREGWSSDGKRLRGRDVRKVMEQLEPTGLRGRFGKGLSSTERFDDGPDRYQMQLEHRVMRYIVEALGSGKYPDYRRFMDDRQWGDVVVTKVRAFDDRYKVYWSPPPAIEFMTLEGDERRGNYAIVEVEAKLETVASRLKMDIARRFKRRIPRPIKFHRHIDEDDGWGDMM